MADIERNYIVLKCKICGKHTIIPIEEWSDKKGYVTCWNIGKHKNLKVVGAFDIDSVIRRTVKELGNGGVRTINFDRKKAGQANGAYRKVENTATKLYNTGNKEKDINCLLDIILTLKHGKILNY